MLLTFFLQLGYTVPFGIFLCKESLFNQWERFGQYPIMVPQGVVFSDGVILITLIKKYDLICVHGMRYIISRVVFCAESKSDLCFFPAHPVSEIF